MARYIVDSQIDNHEKYYFIREQESQDIVLLPSKYLMHKKRSKLSPNTIRRSAGAISYYLNYIDETGIQLDDVWEMPYDKQQEHFTDYLIWLQAGLHSGDSYKKKPYNETCNAYLKEVFRFYRFSGQQDESTKQLKVLSDMRIIVHNSVGVKRTLYRNTFHGYLQEKGHIGKTIEQDKIVILLKACANCRDQILLLLLAETGFRIRLGYDLSVLAGDGVVNNAYEALTKLPGVKETKGVLTLAGTGNLTVVLNGKPTTMDAGQLETLLRNTPLDRVEKAEVMYSAPPEYHVR